MASADASPLEPTDLVAAEARRRRAFRLAMLLPLLWLILLLAVRLVWGCVADQRLQAEIDRIRAAGEPILLPVCRARSNLRLPWLDDSAKPLSNPEPISHGPISAVMYG
jgi:hypothetical protein